MFEHLTLENIIARPEILVPLFVFYAVFFWVLPMLGVGSNPRKIPVEQLMPYWKAVRQVSGIFHLAAVICVGLVWLAYPYIVIQ